MWHVLQDFLQTLRAAQWIPITAARVLIGVFFCVTGGAKLLIPARFASMEQTLVQSHVPFPHANAIFVSLIEFACGAGLVIGLLTPLCAFALTADMIVALVTDRMHSINATGLLSWIGEFLYLPEVLYVIILVWLIFSGAGRYSVDGLIGL